MLEKLEKIKVVYTKIIVMFCAIVCVVILVMNVAQVIFRYLTSRAFVFTEDVSVIGMLWVMGLGISLGTLHHEHLMINVVDAIVSKKTLKVIIFCIDVFLILSGVMMTWVGVLAARMNKGFTQSMLGFDESFRYWPVVVGGILTVLAAIICVIEQIIKWSNGAKDDEEAVK